MAYKILVVGKLKSDAPEYDIIERYKKRFKTSISIIEVDVKSIKDPHQLNIEENKELEKLLSPTDINIAMDKDGKSYTSENFATLLDNKSLSQPGADIVFVIGGADGLNNSVKQLCPTRISFGLQTWPHMLARVMLIEQLYRAQCINEGHPYHK